MRLSQDKSCWRCKGTQGSPSCTVGLSNHTASVGQGSTVHGGHLANWLLSILVVPNNLTIKFVHCAVMFVAEWTKALPTSDLYFFGYGHVWFCEIMIKDLFNRNKTFYCMDTYKNRGKTQYYLRWLLYHENLLLLQPCVWQRHVQLSPSFILS